MLDKGFSVETISFDEINGIISGTQIPSSSPGIDFPVGSLYLHQDGSTTGKLWKKVGTSPVDWVELNFSNASSPNGISGNVLAFGAIPPIAGTTIITLETIKYKKADPKSLTPPTVSEGTELWTATVIPQSPSSILKIDVTGVVGYAYEPGYMYYPVVLALFRDTVCIGATVCSIPPFFSFVTNQHWTFVDKPQTSSAVTYSMRIGFGGQKQSGYDYCEYDDEHEDDDHNEFFYYDDSEEHCMPAAWAFNFLQLRDQNKVIGQVLGDMLAKTGYSIIEV